MSSKQVIWVVILLTAALGIYFFGNRTVPAKTESTQSDQESVLPETQIWEEANQSLTEEERKKVAGMEKAIDTLTNPEQRAMMYEGLSAFWNKKGLPAASALSRLYGARQTGSSSALHAAGSMLMHAAELSTDSNIQKFLFGESLETLQRASKLDSTNLDIQADWARAVVLTSANPMEGIMRLRNITQNEPRHLRANYHLARMAITSGQLPKAVARFRQIIEWYPAYPDAYLGLGEAYHEMGNSDSALYFLNQYKGLVPDPDLHQQVDEYIRQFQKP
ncbi:MAG: tetratricopeptide repeat protein [Bacteroidota bacterium]